MVELNKSDIEAVARSRFAKRQRKKIWGSFLGWGAVAIGAIILCDRASSEVGLTAYVLLLVIGVIGVILWSRAEDKAVKAFVEECGNNPLLPYVPTPERRVTNEQDTAH